MKGVPAIGAVSHPRMGGRITLLALGALALIAGLWGAAGRLGWTLPHGAALATLHGPLMISGLFGTLISLERAVALGQRWSYAAPAFAGLGTLALIAGVPEPAGAGAYTAAAVVLAGGSLLITIQQPALFTGILLLGALTWLAGNILWLVGCSIPDLVGWWLAFLILTIVGERLELNRLMPPRRGGEVLFLFAASLLVMGAQRGILTESGAVLFGSSLLVSTFWLLRHDIARLNVRRTSQTRFMAFCMLAGYAWLAVAGTVLIALSTGDLAYAYDIALHAILIGFAISMVFGHALIILPAVARARVRYASFLYIPLLLLHASVALRVSAGLAGWEAGRKGSGIITVVALASFAGGAAIATWNAQRESPT